MSKNPWKGKPAAGRPFLAALALLAGLAAPASGIAEDLPAYLADRGRGIQASIFGTFIEKGDFILYTYYEYYYDEDEEYKPAELGYVVETDYFGKSVENEFLVFVGYGLTDAVALEFEAAVYTTKTLEKDPDDISTMPDRIKESGLGDVESQVRWRWCEETQARPEMFSFFEVVFPLQEDRKIIGTQDWEFALGFGAIKGLSFGTLTGRIAAAYDTGEEELEFGEYAVDYVKRISPAWRLVASVEGFQDEVEFVVESQHALSDKATLKLNLGVGLTEKAVDLAPEMGVLWRL